MGKKKFARTEDPRATEAELDTLFHQLIYMLHGATTEANRKMRCVPNPNPNPNPNRNPNSNPNHLTLTLTLTSGKHFVMKWSLLTQV